MEDANELDVAQCPQDCGNDRAYYFQLQIRSADEPMTTFYRVNIHFLFICCVVMSLNTDCCSTDLVHKVFSPMERKLADAWFFFFWLLLSLL